MKKLVELKGGDLTVSSRHGAGSTFNFTNWFSIAAQPRGENSIKPDIKLPLLVNTRVLVAEDNMINQFMVSKMLKDWNVEVELADNGLKAVELLKQGGFDLVLMDTHMPGMNGYQAARMIRMEVEEPMRSVPIISLSASAFEHEQLEALSAGMNDVLSKPFEAHELHGKIINLLEGKSEIKKLV